MKKLMQSILIISVFFINLTQLFCQNYTKFNNNSSSNKNEELLDRVIVSKWKNGASACVNLSFDDNNYTATRISRFLNKYGFKGTFFINAGLSFNADSLQNIIDQGHEMGNHTFDHMRFSIQDSSQIAFNIVFSKTYIENKFGIKCVSFAEPGHVKTDIGTKLIFQNHLFCRNYSEYPDVIQKRIAFSTLKDTISLSDSLNMVIKDRTFLKLSGHGINTDGYLPTPEKLLDNCLKLLKRHSDNSDVWVTTLKEGSLYENLYHDLYIKKILKKDTLYVIFNNYDSEKYRDMESSPITIEVPYDLSDDVTVLTENAELLKGDTRFYITTDLQNDTCLTLKLNGLFDSLKNVSLSTPKLFPNPAKNILNIRSDYLDSQHDYFAEVYDISGHYISRFIISSEKMVVSGLSSGEYLLKISLDTEGVKSKNNIFGRFIKL